MILNNIKNKQHNDGFTIVELLVVIVVIGILAAITIVSYLGITAKANTSKAESDANSVLSVADVYYAEKNYYPAQSTTVAMTTADWKTSAYAPTTAKIPSGLNIIRIAVTATSGLDSISVECLTTCTNTTGLRIGYWDFSLATPAKAYIYAGAATSGGTFVFPAT